MWPPPVVRAVCNVLGSTNWPGLTNSEINELLAALGIPEPGKDPKKRQRLWVALTRRQERDQSGDCLVGVVAEAMAPRRYVTDSRRFEALRGGLSEALSIIGLRVDEQGAVTAAPTATSVDNEGQLAGRLRTELRRRGGHSEVLRYCEAGLLRVSLCHMVIQATRGVVARLQQMSGMTTDGADLVEGCFKAGRRRPMVRINGYRTEAEVNEHAAFAGLVAGLVDGYGTVPSPTSRAPAGWPMSESDTLDLLSALSLVHRHLDGSTVTRP
jgi:uncharacterized protein (TIGR02391 family)